MKGSGEFSAAGGKSDENRSDGCRNPTCIIVKGDSVSEKRMQWANQGVGLTCQFREC